MISICLGYVRIAEIRDSTDWHSARARLRDDIYRTYPSFNGPDLAMRHKADELANLAKAPAGGLLVTSGQWASMDCLRYAQEGKRGLTAGDLACVHMHSNGSSDYTIDVKCKITAIDGIGHRATVRVTGDSIQFTRGEKITIPSTFLRPRNGK